MQKQVQNEMSLAPTMAALYIFVFIHSLGRIMSNDIQDNRFKNFEKLIREAGGVSKLAKQCGYDKPAYLYQVRSKTVKPNGTTLKIGNRMAAKLEKGMSKPAGWMDFDHDNGQFMPMVQHYALPQSGSAANSIQTVTLAWTGASGMPYGLRLLEVLLQAGKNVWLVYSQAAQVVAAQEMALNLPTTPAEAQKMLCDRYQVSPQQLRVFGREEWFAPIASGNSVADAMVICPASMGTIAAIAHGLSDNLIERAADVSIKERRPVVIVPRETPLSAIHLENMLKLTQNGCVILPPAAGFYHHPKTVDDMVNFVVARILDQLHIPHALLPKWGE